MERLTIKYHGQFVSKEICTINRHGEAVNCMTCGGICEESLEMGCAVCPIQKVFKRLAEYEDLGLTPDQLKELDKRYAEKCEQVKEIVKRLEKEAEESKGHPEISGAYTRAIYIIKEIAEGWPKLTDDKLVDLAVKAAEQRKNGENEVGIMEI